MLTLSELTMRISSLLIKQWTIYVHTYHISPDIDTMTIINYILYYYTRAAIVEGAAVYISKWGNAVI